MKNTSDTYLLRLTARACFILFLLTLVLQIIEPAIGVHSGAYAEDSDVLEQIEKRVSDLEKKTSEISTKQEHTDKHILHMKEILPRIIDGLSIAGGITLIIQGTSGNKKNDPPRGPGEDAIDANISLDLELETEMGKSGVAFLLVEMSNGDGLQDDEIVSFWGVNGDAGYSGSNVQVTEAWYEQRFFNEKLHFTVGKVDLTNYFDGNDAANDETKQFLATGFVNNSAVEFPDNTIGSRLTWNINELLDLSFGWQDADGDFEDVFEDSFIMVEVDIKPAFSGLHGNWRGYVWQNNSDHVELDNPANDNEQGWGIGTSIDQHVTDGITVFGRLGYQDPEIYAFDTAWSIGIAMTGASWGRDDDTIGIAYGVAVLSDDYEDILDASLINSADEKHFEAYYSFNLNKHVVISPDIQIIQNALGNSDYETVFVGGMRGQFTF